MSFFLYLAQVALYAAIMWAMYCAVWRNKPLHRGSRIYLLCSLLLPLLLPLIRLPVADNSVVAAYQITLPEIVVGSADAFTSSKAFSWIIAGLCVYASVAAALLLWYLRNYIILFRKLARGKVAQHDNYTITTGVGIGPGTIGKRIFFPADDIHTAILRHELEHIRAGHRYDIALMQLLHVVLWVSPAHWLIRRELKLVHEYEADKAVVAFTSETIAYSELLLSQSFGIQNTSIAHSFFHNPLKLRIDMLQAQQNPARRLRIYAIAALLLVIFSGAVVLAQTKKKKTVKTVSDYGFKDAPVVKDAGNDTVVVEDPVTGKQTTYVAVKDAGTSVLSDGRIVYKMAEQMPHFKGDLGVWLAGHLHYPDSARAHGQQGRSAVQFVVDEAGLPSSPSIIRSSGYPLLDAEALRVVGEMPPWAAGTIKGQKVPVLFTLPVTFKLD